jgi:hypothetical protein
MMKTRRPPTRTVALIVQGLACSSVITQAMAQAMAQEGQDADELARQLSNPVAALISVPFQLNYDTRMGPDSEGERWTLNIQPVVPISLNEHWNVISRTILPIIEQSDVIPGDDSQSGIGDVVQSLFFSPKEPGPGGWIIGVGPVFSLPTASDDALGSEQWGLGPTFVVLKQTASQWTYGMLANHVWSVAGDEDRSDISATFLQPFLTKGLGKGASFSVNTESTYDWKAQQWNVPINLTYSKVTQVGGQRMSLAFGGRYFIESPPGGAEWGLRAALTLLYPK